MLEDIQYKHKIQILLKSDTSKFKKKKPVSVQVAKTGILIDRIKKRIAEIKLLLRESDDHSNDVTKVSNRISEL